MKGSYYFDQDNHRQKSFTILNLYELIVLDNSQNIAKQFTVSTT